MPAPGFHRRRGAEGSQPCAPAVSAMNGWPRRACGDDAVVPTPSRRLVRFFRRRGLIDENAPRAYGFMPLCRGAFFVCFAMGPPCARRASSSAAVPAPRGRAIYGCPRLRAMWARSFAGDADRGGEGRAFARETERSTRNGPPKEGATRFWIWRPPYQARGYATRLRVPARPGALRRRRRGIRPSAVRISASACTSCRAW